MSPVDTPIPSTRGALLARSRADLVAAGIDTAAREAGWILMDGLGIDRPALIGWPDHPVAEGDTRRILGMVGRRARHEPLQYVLGFADFRGRRFRVDRRVLIPRPETEELVARALDLMPGDGRVLDVGTGSGCIAVSVALERPMARVTGCDVSADALDVARENADVLDARVSLVLADMTDGDFDRAVGGTFDLVVSNPPYVAEADREGLETEVIDHEPHIALFAGEDPLRYYRALARHMAGRLSLPGAALLTEIHADHGSEVAAVFESAGLERVEVTRDASGRDRFCCGFRSST